MSLLPCFWSLARKFSLRLAVTRSKGAHALTGAPVATCSRFYTLPLSYFERALARRERESERGVSCRFHWHTHRSAEDLAVKPCAFVRLHTFSQILHSRKKRERKKRSARGEGRRNNQNATRIRWDPTPEREREREKRQELGARKTRGRKKKSGETFDISFATTRF